MPAPIDKSILIFGKMPSFGDFVERGLSERETRQWATFLSEEVGRAESELGAEFAAAWDRAPPWMVVTPKAEGVMMVGLLGASRDRVGRRFPLLVGRRFVDSSQWRAALDACCNAVYSAFRNLWTTDQLALALGAEIAAGTIPEPPNACGWWLEDEGGAVMARREGLFPEGLVTTMLRVKQAEDEV